MTDKTWTLIYMLLGAGIIGYGIGKQYNQPPSTDYIESVITQREATEKLLTMCYDELKRERHSK